MKFEKLSMASIKNVLSRAELRKIMAGSGGGIPPGGGGGGTGGSGGGCSNYYTCNSHSDGRYCSIICCNESCEAICQGTCY